MNNRKSMRTTKNRKIDASTKSRKSRKSRKGVKPGRSRGTEALLRGLEELEACVRQGVRPQDRFPSRSHTVFRAPRPGSYPPAAVARLRQRLGVSQAGFAELLGVSRILVQGWERGVRRPSPLASRLLDTIRHDAAAWLAGLRERQSGPRRRAG